MNDFRPSWIRCWPGAGAAGDGETVFAELLQRHAEGGRRYHTLQHLRECLTWFERTAHLAEHPHAVELALWFHDAVYDMHRSDNEERSAGLARTALLAAHAPAERVEQVAQLILATKHSAPPSTPDAQLVVDIDLAILGAPEARFAEYEGQIREEYAFVPELLFQTRRREILQSFLARERIYSTAFFYGALEAQARRNLSRSIAVHDA